MSALVSEAKYRAHECTEDYLKGSYFVCSIGQM